MLRLPPLRLRQPASLAEALAIVDGERSEARLIAGGTDLLPNLKRRHQHATTLVSLMNIPGLADIVDGDRRRVRLGATAVLTSVAEHPAVRTRFPALARAVESISSPPLRNMGTLGGNLCLDTRCTYYNQTEEWRRSIDYCMKEEGTICWVATCAPRCWAHTASDAAPMCVRWGRRCGWRAARVSASCRWRRCTATTGSTTSPSGPTRCWSRCAVPAAADAAHCRSAFWKLRRRGSIDFAVLSVAAVVWVDPAGVVERAAIWLRCGGVGAARGSGRRAGAGGRPARRRSHRSRCRAGEEGGDADGQHRLPDPVAQGRGRPLRRGRAARLRGAAGRAAAAALIWSRSAVGRGWYLHVCACHRLSRWLGRCRSLGASALRRPRCHRAPLRHRVLSLLREEELLSQERIELLL